MMHVTHDPTHLREFHNGHLSTVKGDTKKVTRYASSCSRLSKDNADIITRSYKQRILFYLLSHVNACSIASVQISLLQSLQTTINESKSEALAPTLERLSNAVAPTTETVDKEIEGLFMLATATIDSTAISELNNAQKPAWSTFEAFLRSSLLNREGTFSLKSRSPLLMRCLQVI